MTACSLRFPNKLYSDPIEVSCTEQRLEQATDNCAVARSLRLQRLQEWRPVNIRHLSKRLQRSCLTERVWVLHTDAFKV